MTNSSRSIPLFLMGFYVLTTGCAKVTEKSLTSVPSARLTIPGAGGSGLANPPDSWRQISRTLAPAARSLHTAVWTGSEMIIFGGRDQQFNALKSGGRYNPITDSWQAMSLLGAPTPRSGHSAVWTGNRMIVFGGIKNGDLFGSTSLSGKELRTGGIYDPATNTWVLTPTMGAPSARTEHIAVWTGDEMLVYGGKKFVVQTSGLNVGSVQPVPLRDGAAYNPATNTWRPISPTNAPAVVGPDFLVGDLINNRLFALGSLSRAGGLHDVALDSWKRLPPTNPTGFGKPTAVTMGNEVVVFGGNAIAGGGRVPPLARNPQVFNSDLNQWFLGARASTNRAYHTAVATNSRTLLIFGGIRFAQDGQSLPVRGEKYNLSTNSWSSLSQLNAASPRFDHTAVWSGSEMIVWGGNTNADMFSGPVTNTGGAYTP